MDQNEIPHDPRDLGVPSRASKIIFEPMVRSAQAVHLSCVKISTISKRTKTSFTSPMSHTSTIGCVQNDCWANGEFIASEQLTCIEVNTVSK